MYPIIQADTVISSESIEITTVGKFDDPSQWDISSTSGFSNNPADYTIGMIADDELSFTHIRPDNFLTQNSWASSSSSGSNYSLGALTVTIHGLKDLRFQLEDLAIRDYMIKKLRMFH